MTRLATLGVALAALNAPAALRGQAIPVKPAGELSSVVGLQFDVPITADMSARTERLGSFALRLQWRPAVLRLDTGVTGSFGGVTVNTDSVANGVLRMAGASPSGATGLVTLGIGRFTPISGDTTTLGLTLSELYASGSFANLLPSAVVSAGQYCTAIGRFGDIDGDGIANSRDGLIALSIAVGLDVSPFNVVLGDVDASGATDARDALIVLSYGVGLDVSGFRVMRVAGGACAANGPLAMSITPSPLALVLGQSAQLEARATNGSGALQSIPDVVWRSGAPGVASVTSEGRVTAVSAGSAVITALRGVSDSAKATVTVALGRTRHVVDATVVNATNQLGSAALPFATIAAAVGFAKAGDTIEVRPGRYSAPVVLDRDVLLLGDTLPDGTRPTIFGVGDPLDAGAGVQLLGTGSRRVFHLGFENLYDAVEISGPDVALLRGLRSTRVENGIVTDSAMTSLRIERSRLVGRGVAIFDSDALQVNAHVGTLVIENTELGDFGSHGVYAPDLDSIAILRSNLHDFGYYGLELGGDGASVALVVDSSTVRRSGSTLFYVQDLRSGLITRSVLANEGNDAVFSQFQENILAGGYLILRNDSINVRGHNWIDVSYLDSVVVDSLRAVLPNSDGNISIVPLVRVTRSSFRDVSNNVLNTRSNGGMVTVTNSSFVGDPHCDLCANAIYTLLDARTTVDSVTFINIQQAVQTYGDSSLTVTNSTFRRVQYPVQFYGSGGSNGGLAMRHNTLNGFTAGVQAFTGAMTIEDNTFVGGQDANCDCSPSGIETNGSAAQSIQRNVFDDVNDPILVTLRDSSVTAVIADNVLTNVTGTVIGAYGNGDPDSLRMRFEVLRNQVTCAAGGDEGVYINGSDATVADNRITGCGTGVYLYHQGTSARTDSVLRNTLVLPSNPYGGVYAFGSIRSRISGNIVTADTVGYSSIGDIWMEGPYYLYGYAPGTTLVDSNMVSGGTTTGIYVADLDTAVVARNSVTDVASTYYGAIALTGSVKYLAGIAGNTVRRAKVDGITTSNSDTATVQVDSNLVSASGARGIVAEYGAAQITRNTVVNSGTDGIRVLFDAITTLPITLNNISGNVQFGLRGDGQGVNAPSNWWGDARGPRCDTGCDSLSVGDRVTLGVTHLSPLPAPYASAPPAPPASLRAFASVGARAPRAAFRALPAREVMPTARAAAPQRAPRVRVAVTPSASRMPASLPPARVQALQARVQKQAVRVAARQQVESRRAAERVATESVSQARVAGLRAQVTAARAAAQAAARRAPPASVPTPGRRP